MTSAAAIFLYVAGGALMHVALCEIDEDMPFFPHVVMMSVWPGVIVVAAAMAFWRGIFRDAGK